jgi:hypothetical protein
VFVLETVTAGKFRTFLFVLEQRPLGYPPTHVCSCMRFTFVLENVTGKFHLTYPLFSNNLWTVTVTAKSRLFFPLCLKMGMKWLWKRSKKIKECFLYWTMYFCILMKSIFKKMYGEVKIYYERLKLKLLNLILFRWGQSWGFSIWIEVLQNCLNYFMFVIKTIFCL